VCHHAEHSDRLSGGKGACVGRDEAGEFVASNHWAVLVTRRSGEGLQTSPVLVGVDGEGRWSFPPGRAVLPHAGLGGPGPCEQWLARPLLHPGRHAAAPSLTPPAVGATRAGGDRPARHDRRIACHPESRPRFSTTSGTRPCMRPVGAYRRAFGLQGDSATSVRTGFRGVDLRWIGERFRPGPASRQATLLGGLMLRYRRPIPQRRC
jgi:hypothetical protein